MGRAIPGLGTPRGDRDIRVIVGYPQTTGVGIPGLDSPQGEGIGLGALGLGSPCGVWFRDEPRVSWGWTATGMVGMRWCQGWAPLRRWGCL